MTLMELCEPLFAYMCALNRRYRASVSAGAPFELDARTVEAEVRGILADIKNKGMTDGALVAKYQKVQRVLAYFVDSMIRNGPYPFRDQWEPISTTDYDSVAYDSDFFQELDLLLQDRSEQALEPLAIFYTCMGLGFCGEYADLPEELRLKMRQIGARIQSLGLPTSADQIAREDRLAPPEAHVADTRVLHSPASWPITLITFGFIGLVVVLIAANSYIYFSTVGGIRASVGEILKNLSQVVPAN